MPKKKRVGVLTGGGDCPGLNAVIRAVVKTGVSDMGWEVLGVADAFNGLMSTPYDVHELNRDAVRGILRRGGTILGTTNRGDPFEFPVKQSDGSFCFEDRSDRLVEAMRILELEGLIVIGGDGTMRIAHRLMVEKGIKVVGVPKTIDNDIAATDVTFGFNTAVEVATDAIDRLHSTAESHDRVMIAEVMGRDCGWIAAYAGIGSGADVILIPEIPYDISKVCDKVRRRQAAGRFFSIVVVAEGALPIGGAQAYLDKQAAGGMPRLGGAGALAAEAIAEASGLETRVTVLGHLLRGGRPSGYDRVLATRFGTAAMTFVEEGRWGQMVALKGSVIEGVAIEEAASGMKRVDPNGPLVESARHLGIEFG
ncbi:MAG: ATP-dependent 6-phosphofructokinase [Deltaproteobacteria bacterium]|jgi:phosphofructokinase-like protein